MNTPTRKHLNLVLSLVIVFSFLAACQPTAAPETNPEPIQNPDVQEEPQEAPVELNPVQEPTSDPSSQITTITFFSHRFTETPYGEILRQQVAEYEDLNPNIKIEILEVPTSDRQAKLIAMILGGSPPDAIFAARDMGYYLPQGVMMDLEPFIAREGGDSFKANFPPQAAATVTDPEDKHWYGLPAETQLWTLVVNQTAADKAGVEIPADGIWGWEEFMDAANKFNNPDAGKYAYVNYGYGSASGQAIVVGQWMLANGGSYWGISSDCSNVDLLTPENIEAIENYISLGLEGYQPAGYIERGGGDHYRLMGDGTAAMAVTHPGGVANALSKSEGKISAFVPVFLPGLDPKVSLFNESWAIGEGAEHPEEAWEFIKWLNSDEKSLERMAVQGTLPASISGLEKAAEQFPDMTFWTKLTSPEWSEPACYEYLPRTGEIVQTASDGLTRIYQGEDATAVLEELQPKLDALVKGE